MYVVFYRIIVRKERIQGIHFIFPFFIAQGGGGNYFETLTALAYLKARNFFILLLAMCKIAQLKQW